MMNSVLMPRTGSNSSIDCGLETPPRAERLPETAEEERLLREWEPTLRCMAGRWANVAEREDLEQVARIALWQAARRFDPARGCSFGTFAFPTIRGALLRHLRDRAGAVRVPRHWWELRPHLQRQADAAAQELGREPTIPELADRLGTTEEEIEGALGARDLSHPASLDEPRETQGHEEVEPLAATIGALDPHLEAVELRVVVRQAVAQLSVRLREVIEQRYFSGRSQKAVGRRLGISQVHVSRLERWALARLRAELHEAQEAAATMRGPEAPQYGAAISHSAGRPRRPRPALAQ
jgi:RNA polymerase sigma-B factor